MLAVALKQLQWDKEQGCYELSVGNPDKGVLPLQEVLQRLQQFTTANLPIVVTHVSELLESPSASIPEAVGFHSTVPVSQDAYHRLCTEGLLSNVASKPEVVIGPSVRHSVPC